MLSTLLHVGLATAVCAALLAIPALLATRFSRRPALVHALWLLVLVKLVTPPVVRLPVAWLPEQVVATAPAPEPLDVVFRTESTVPIEGPFDDLPLPGPATLLSTPEARNEGANVLPAAGQAPDVSVPAGMVVPVPDVGPAEQAAAPAPLVSWGLADLVTLAGLLWLAGSAVCLARSGLCAWRFSRLLRYAQPAGAEIQEEADRLARRMGLARSPAVWLMPGPLPPLVWAIGALRIFFPNQLLGRLSDEERASLLAHELAHVRRRDHWVRWLEVIVVGLYWWYPLVWLARRQLQAREEECCDAWAVETVAPRVYASAILEAVDFLSENRKHLPAVASGLSGMQALKQRLTLIMGQHTPRGLTHSARLAVVALGVALLPLLPSLARPEKKAAGAADKAQVGEPRPKPPAPAVRLAPGAGGTEFANMAINLVGGQYEYFSVAVSPDGRWAAAGGGWWNRPGDVRMWDLRMRKQVLVFHERQGVTSVAFSPDSRRLASAGYGRVARVRDVATGKEQLTLPVDSVARVVFSPDGKMLATASEGKMVKLWDAVSGNELADLKGEMNQFYAVAFSRDGKTLAAGGGAFTTKAPTHVALWDVPSRKFLGKLAGHNGPVFNIAFAPDGKRLVSSGNDATVRVWDFASRKQMAVLTGHTSPVKGLAFSPDGKVLFTGGWDSTLRLWDLASGKQTAVIDTPGGIVREIAVSPDGKHLISTHADRAVRLWDVASRKLISALQQGEDRAGVARALLAVAVSPDGKTVAAATDDRAVELRDASSGELLQTLTGHEDAVTCLAWSPDGKTLATGSPDNLVKLWDVKAGKVRKDLKGHTKWVYALAFSRDGKALASAGYDKTVRLWDAETGASRHVFRGHKASVRSVAFSPDGKLLASGSGDRTAKLWGLDDLKLRATLADHAGVVRGVVFLPDGKTLATGCEDGLTRLWDVGRGRVQSTLKIKGANKNVEVLALALSEKAQMLASGCSNGWVQLYTVPSGLPAGQLRGHNEQVTGLSFSPDGQRLYSVSQDKTIKLWRPQLDLVRSFRGHTGPVRMAIFSPDGRWVLSCGGWPHGDKTLRLWDVTKVLEARQFKGHTDQVLAVAFSPDGKRAVSGGQDGTARLWEVPSGKLLRVFKGHKDGVPGVNFSRDGRWVVTASHDRTVRMWDAATGKCERVFRGHDDWVRVAVFTADGKQILSGGRDRTLRWWNVASGKEERRIDHNKEWVDCLALSKDGRLALTGGGNLMRLWDVASGKEVRQFSGHGFGVTSVAFSGDGKSALSGSYDGSVRLWGLESGKEQHRFQGHRNWVWSVTFAPDGRHVLSAGGGGREGSEWVAGSDFGLRLWALPGARPGGAMSRR